MRIDKFTQKMQEAVQASQDIASEARQQEITNEHFLLALLDQPEGITRPLLEKIGVHAETFAAKKGEKLLLEIQSASLGFPLDARLRIEDANGKELAKNDDSANADPMLEWTPPEDGTFVAAVANVLHRGGPDYRYRLSIQPVLPSVKAVVAANAFTLEPGKTNEIKVTIKRLHGLQSKLTVSARGLPEELKAELTDVSDKGGEATLKLVASADAKPSSGPIQIVVAEVDSGKEYRAVNELITSGSNNGVPNGFNKLVIEATDQLWLTILSAPAAKAKAE